MDALTVFMKRTKKMEQNELNHKYAAIHAILTAALWNGLPSHARLPVSATRPNRFDNQPATEDFQVAGRGA